MEKICEPNKKRIKIYLNLSLIKRMREGRKNNENEI